MGSIFVSEPAMRGVGMRKGKLAWAMSAFAFFTVTSCSVVESRQQIPAMNGLYRCIITSTEPVGTERIPPGSRYYRYFNVDVNGQSQRSVIYHPYPNDPDYENRTSIQWMPTDSHKVADKSDGIFTTIRAYDGQNVCFFINPATEGNPGNSVIDGRNICALRMSPASGIYTSNIALLPEQGVCERIGG